MRCTGLLQNKGELPRLPPTPGFRHGRVTLPWLQHLGCYGRRVEEPSTNAGVPSEQRQARARTALGAPQDIYALRRASVPFTGVQRYVDFPLLLRSWALREAGLRPKAPRAEQEASSYHATKAWLQADS